MSVDKKYYYMRLKDTFFHSVEVAALESEEKGYQYSNLLLKMYLLSLRGEGRLMAGKVPYTPARLAKATGHDLRTVEEGLRLFQDLGLIEIMETGAIYMLDIQEYIGHSGTEADRKREYRHRKKLEETYPVLYVENPELLLGRDICPDNPPPEKETEKETKKETEKEI